MADRWGLVATVLAPTETLLRFVAYHLEAGAHRVHIYLDAPDPVAFDALKGHSKCRVTTCDDAWWDRHNGRPRKHQVRQAVNATHAYNRKADIDWLIHMDVDEFLVSDKGIAEVLSTLPDTTPVARARPMEALAGEGDDATHFKGFIPAGPKRAGIVDAIYPTFGAHVKGGFLSHLAGKVFLRTGMQDVRFQIHNAFQDGAEIKGADMPQDEIALAHCHARTWEDWLAHYRFRLDRGSYRAELAPNKPRDKGGLSLHELFQNIEDHDGEAGLRAFFDEVCANTSDLRARLETHGLLRRARLALDNPLSTHFPNVTL